MTRPSRRPLALALSLGLSLLGVAAVAPAAHAVGAPIVVDAFNGTHFGTRTTTSTTSPPNSDPAAATISESGNAAHIHLTGPGNSAGVLLLDYAVASPGTDLTGGPNGNEQLFMEFASIVQNDYGQNGNFTGLNLTVTVTDKNGASGLINTGIGNTYAFSPALPFNCSAVVLTCFSKNGPIDFKHITHLQFRYAYPRNHDPGGTLDIVLNKVRATPLGGAAPTAPNPGVTATDPQAVCPGGAAHFAVVFTHVDTINGFEQAPVSYQPPSTTGVRAQDVVVDGGTGTLPTGTLSKSVTGGPSTYDVAVSGMTSNGKLHVSIPSGVVQDAWGTFNQASTGEPTITANLTLPPLISGPAAGALPAVVTGTAYSQQVTLSQGTAPITYSISAGALPNGLTLDTSTGAITGTPTVGGAYSFTVKAHNVCSPDATRAFTQIVDQPPTISTANPPVARVGGPYAGFTFTATGYPASTFSVTGGALPAGMTLSSGGVLSGTPAVGTAGADTFTVTATNGVAPDSSHQFTLNVDLPPHITSAVPPADGAVGTPYSHTYTATGFPAPTWSVITGAIPTGLTLDTTTGALSGTPTAGGSFSFTVEATNVEDVDTQDATIVVTKSPTLDPTDPPHATVGTAYSQKLGSTGGPAFTLTGGALPNGLALGSDGTISGTPAVGTAGSYTFTATADNGQPPTASHQYTIDVWQAPAMTSGNPPDGNLNTAYPTFVVTASGFPTPTFAPTAGTLPTGLTLATDGTLSGTPTAVGSFTFTVTASSSAGTATHDYTIHITDAPAITSGAPVHGVVGTAYTFPFTASGTPTPTYAVTGSVPPGLTLNTVSGVLSGTPTTAGTYALTLTASNGTLPNATQAYQLIVDQAPAFTSPAPAAATVGTAYTHTFTATGSPKPTYAVTLGTLPAGLVLDATTGVLSGTPAAVGSSPFTVTAGNGIGTAATQAVSFAVGKITTTTATTLGRTVLVTGTLVTLTAHVTPSLDTGLVTFAVDGAPVGSSSLSGGVASIVIHVGAPGPHQVGSTYAGDGTHAASVSPTLGFTALGVGEQQPGRAGVLTTFLHYIGSKGHVGGKVVVTGPGRVHRLALVARGGSARFRNLAPGTYTVRGTALRGEITVTTLLVVGHPRTLGLAVPFAARIR